MGVNKVEYYGETLIDTTGTTVSEETLMEGETAINAAGEVITGNLRPVKYTAQNPTAAEQAQARKNIDALGTGDLPEAINDALAQAKASGQFDGKDGQDGQPGKDGQPGSNGKDGSNGVNGKDGVGIDTLQQVVESTESEGENVWRATLTDGKTSDFTVRNGRDGVDGKTAYESAQDGGYAGTEQQFMKTLANCVTRNHEHEWRQIVDRPFGEFAVGTGANTVISNDIVYGRFIKVSDATPTLAEVQRGGKISYYITDQQYGGAIEGELITTNYPQGDLTVISSTDGVVIAYDGIPLVVVAFENGAEILFNTYEKGTYFNQGTLYYCVHSLTINNYSGFEIYETITIPEKYLPEGDINAEADKAFNIESSNTIKWDGNTKGLPNINNYGHKVSNDTPTLEELSEGGSFKWVENNVIKTGTFNASDISIYSDDVFIIYCSPQFGDIVVSLTDNAPLDKYVIPEKGIYLSSYDDKYVCELTLNGYQFNSIALKSQSLTEHGHDWYGDVVTKGNTVKSDCLIHGTDGTYVKVSDDTPSAAELQEGGMIRYYNVSNSNFSELHSNNYLEGSFNLYSSDEACCITENGLFRILAVIAYKSNPSVGAVSFPYATEPGIYFKQDDSLCVHSLTINEYEGLPHNMEKIPAEFLPEDIGAVKTVNGKEPDENGNIEIEGGSGGGGVSSWNDLTDKPFGETTVMGDTLTWDANTEGREVVDPFGNGQSILCHVSDTVPTQYDFIPGGKVVYGKSNGGKELAYNNILPLGDGALVEDDFNFGIVPQDNMTITIPYGGTTLTLTFPKKGVYFGKTADGGYTKSLIINGYAGFETTETKPLDIKYFPKSHQFGEETVMGDTFTWDGNADGLECVDPIGNGMMLLYHVSDVVPTMGDFASGAIAGFSSGNKLQLASSEVVSLGDGVLTNSDFWFVISPEDNLTKIVPYNGMNITVTLPKKGIYFGAVTGGSYTNALTINGYTGFETTEVTPLEPKYLPKISIDVTGIEIDTAERAITVNDIPYTPLRDHFLKGGIVEFTRIVESGTRDEFTMRAISCDCITDSKGTTVLFTIIDPLWASILTVHFTTP